MRWIRYGTYVAIYLCMYLGMSVGNTCHGRKMYEVPTYLWRTRVGNQAGRVVGYLSMMGGCTWHRSVPYLTTTAKLHTFTYLGTMFVGRRVGSMGQ